MLIALAENRVGASTSLLEIELAVPVFFGGAPFSSALAERRQPRGSIDVRETQYAVGAIFVSRC
jgi:hypothetical protein